MTGNPAAGSRSRARVRLLDLLPLFLAALAEAAWIAVVYALLQAAVRAPEVLGLPGLLAATLLGVWAVRAIAPRAGTRWPGVATGLVCGAAIVGWLAGPNVASTLASGQIVEALRLHPGGFLAGLAVLRGIAHSSAEGSEAALDRLVTVGTPALVLPLLLGGAFVEPWRSTFYASAVLDIAVFLVAGMLGLAISRSVSMGLAAGFDWRRNRAWLGMLGAGVVVVAAVALSGSSAVETVVRLVVTLAVLPLLVVGFFAGLPHVSRRDILVVLFALLAVIAVATVVSQLGTGPGTGLGGGGGIVGGEIDDRPTILASILLVIGAVLLVLVLIGAWMRTSRRPEDGDVPEERMIDFGEASTEASAPRRRRRQRGAGPVDAPTAYVALLRDLEREDLLRRDPAESPAEHARRLRRDGRGALGLDLLAADYELARFGEIGLTAAEHRRGIARWRRLRRILPAARI